jgi:hypothetical protein
MSRAPRRRAASTHAIIALLDDRPGDHKALLKDLIEVPLPGRPPVTLGKGQDPTGCVPGFSEALSRRERLLSTLVHCPEKPLAFALNRVLLRSGEVELHLVIFASTQPNTPRQAMAQLVLRFQAGSGHVEARVQSTTHNRLAEKRADRLAAARRTSGAKPAATDSSREPEGLYTLTIDDDTDLPPPFNPDRLFDPENRPGAKRGAKIRVLGLFGLFLATVATWQIFETNQDAVAHERFNQRLVDREAEARSETDAASTTTVRLGATPVAVGDLDMSDFENALLPVLERVGECYQNIEGWATLPPEGLVSFEMVLAAHRRVESVTVVRQELDSDAVVACAVEALEGLSAGLESESGNATVSLMLRFSG